MNHTDIATNIARNLTHDLSIDSISVNTNEGMFKLLIKDNDKEIGFLLTSEILTQVKSDILYPYVLDYFVKKGIKLRSYKIPIEDGSGNIAGYINYNGNKPRFKYSATENIEKDNEEDNLKIKIEIERDQEKDFDNTIGKRVIEL